MVPRGLRVQIFPAREGTTYFLQTWGKGLFQCSRIIMSLFKDHDRELLAQTKNSIRELELSLSKFDAERLKERLKETIDRYEKSIVSVKKQKFMRNRTDYDRKMTYKWKQVWNGRVVDKTLTINNAKSTSIDYFFIIRKQRSQRKVRRGLHKSTKKVSQNPHPKDNARQQET